MSKPPSRRRPTTTNSRRGVSTGRAAGNRSSKGGAKNQAAAKPTKGATAVTAKGLTAREAAAKVAAAKVAAAKTEAAGSSGGGTATATVARPATAPSGQAGTATSASTPDPSGAGTSGTATTSRTSPKKTGGKKADTTKAEKTKASGKKTSGTKTSSKKTGGKKTANEKAAGSASAGTAVTAPSSTTTAGGGAAATGSTDRPTPSAPAPSSADTGAAGDRRTGADNGRRKDDAATPTDGRRSSDRPAAKAGVGTPRTAVPGTAASRTPGSRGTTPPPPTGDQAVSKTARSATKPASASSAATAPAGRPGRPLPAGRSNRSVGSSTARKGTDPEPGPLDRLRPVRGRGGVAPFVTPRSRLGRLRLRRTLRRRGFVPLSPGRPRIHHRILPRTVIGISFMLLSFGVGAAFSGAAFYAYYDNRLAENEATVSRFVQTFDTQFADASGALDDLRTDAIDDIRAELVPLQGIVADSTAVVILPERLGPSIWALETRDDDGRIRVGSAFAVAAHQGGTAFVTSYSLVDSSTILPGPGIDLVKDDVRLTAELWAWDAERDLAVVVVEEPIPALEMADAEAQTATVGHGVFAMGGVGGRGATASPGVLLDHSLVGIQHTAAVGTLFVGGPVVDGRGRVIGVATADYRPYGVDHGGVAIAPDVAGMCSELLSCDERLTTVAGAASIADDDTAVDGADGADEDGVDGDGIEDGADVFDTEGFGGFDDLGGN